MTTLTNVEQLKRDIENKQGEIATVQSNIETFEYNCTDEEYDKYLDSIFDEVEICGMTYAVSYALKELDPTAYRCGKSDFESDFELESCEKYADMVSELEALESELEDFESELEDLNDQIDD